MNDDEVRMLTEQPTLLRPRASLMEMGPRIGGGQAGRVRRRALHRGRLLLAARLSARDGDRPDRRGRQLRRRVPRLPGLRGRRPPTTPRCAGR